LSKEAREDYNMIVAAIPACNEENTIARVIMLTQKHVDKVIICDDGSTDMTGRIAERLGAEVLRHETKLGKGSALRTLFQRACQLSPDVVVTLDSDGQHDPEQIPALIKPIIEGQADMVVGSRFVEGAVTDIPKYRRTGLKVVNWLSGKADKSQVKDTQSGFRAYSLKALNIVSSHEANGYFVETEHLAKAARNGMKIIEVPIDVKYKGLPKTSKKRPELHTLELIGSILRLVVEERPLIFLGLPGVVFILIGVAFGVWMVNLYALENRITTNIALASIAFTVIGIFAVFTAITLYAIVRLTYKTSRQK
jgi:glycosyltransferase involved in cell wall biosynthesis